MIGRIALSSLFVVCLLCLPAIASQPDGLAGEIITNAQVTPGDPFCFDSFEWYDFFGSSVQLDPTDTLTLSLAIIPFQTGVTALGLDEGQNGTTFVAINFSDGLVQGLPYNRSAWNDVTVQVRPATQDYLISVNGAQAGPFPYNSSCAGGCFSVQAFRFNGSGNAGGAVAWLDSLSVLRVSAAGSEFLAGSGFQCPETQPSVSGGGIVYAVPPQRVRARK